MLEPHTTMLDLPPGRCTPQRKSPSAAGRPRRPVRSSPSRPGAASELAYTVLADPGAARQREPAVLDDGDPARPRRRRVLHDQGPLPRPARPRGDLPRAERRGPAGDGHRGRPHGRRAGARRDRLVRAGALGASHRQRRRRAARLLRRLPGRRRLRLRDDRAARASRRARWPGDGEPRWWSRTRGTAHDARSWPASTSGRRGPRRRSTRSTATLLAEATEATPLRWTAGPVDQDPEAFYGAAVRTLAACAARVRAPAGSRAIGDLRADGGRHGRRCRRSGLDAVRLVARPALRRRAWTALERELGDDAVRDVGLPADGQPRAEDPLVAARASRTAFARTVKWVTPGGYVAGRLAGLARRRGVHRRHLPALHRRWPTRAPARGRSGSPTRAGAEPEQLPRIVEPTTVIGRAHAEAAADVRAAGRDAGRGRAGGHRGGDARGRRRPPRAAARLGRHRRGARRVSVAEFRPDVDAPHADHDARRRARAVGVARLPLRRAAARLAGRTARRCRGGPSTRASPRSWPRRAHAAGRRRPALPAVPRRARAAQRPGRCAACSLGLHRGHGRGHLARAVLEGVALEYAELPRRAARAASRAGLRRGRVGGRRCAQRGLEHDQGLGARRAATGGCRGASSACWGAALVAGGGGRRSSTTSRAPRRPPLPSAGRPVAEPDLRRLTRTRAFETPCRAGPARPLAARPREVPHERLDLPSSARGARAPTTLRTCAPPGATVAGVVDADAGARARALAERCGATAHDVAGGGARAARFDAVVISTPTFTHRDLAVAAARAGKHVLLREADGARREPSATR